MAIPIATPVVSGAVMDASVEAASWAAYRGWVNSIPIADIGDAAVQRENIVKPVLQGFPGNSIRSEVEHVYARNLGLHAPNASSPLHWGARADRLTIMPTVLGQGEVWRTRVGASFVLPYAAHVEASLSFDWQCRSVPFADVPASIYPTGAGAGKRGGYFAFFTFDRRSVVQGEAEVPGSRLFAYVLDTAAGEISFNDSGSMLYAGTLAAGAWDIFLGYVRGTTPAVVQIDVSRITGKIEAHL